MQVLHHPNEALRSVSTEVQVFDKLLSLLVDQMTEQMYVEHGVGLAAPQIGIKKRIILVDPSSGEDSTKFLVMVNPKIIGQSGKAISVEGCLSLPGIRGEVERAASVDVEFQSLSGEKLTIHAEGLQSIIIQHEIDHLDGVLFIDKIKGIRRLTMRKTG